MSNDEEDDWGDFLGGGDEDENNNKSDDDVLHDNNIDMKDTLFDDVFNTTPTGDDNANNNINEEHNVIGIVEEDNKHDVGIKKTSCFVVCCCWFNWH